MKSPSLKTAIFITLLTRIDLFLNLLNNSVQVYKETETVKVMETSTNLNSATYWLIQILATGTIFYIVYTIISKLNTMKSELKIHMLISNFRKRDSFNDAYKNHQFHKLPNETVDEFLARSHDGIYEQKMQQEVFAVRNMAKEVLKDKTMQEIDDLIVKVYDLK